MFLNLLASAFDPSLKDKKISVGEAAIDAVIGLVVVFIGIALLVFIVWGVGKLMQNTSLGRTKKSAQKAKSEASEKKAVTTPAARGVVSGVASGAAKSGKDEIDDETLAVVAAAITAVYRAENRSCGFVVKRIKRM